MLTMLAKEDVFLYLKFAGGMLGIMLLVYLLAVLTPKAAAFVDKKILKKGDAPGPERVEEYVDEEAYSVKSVFGASETDEDLNRLYKEDIYALNQNENDEKDGNMDG